MGGLHGVLIIKRRVKVNITALAAYPPPAGFAAVAGYGYGMRVSGEGVGLRTAGLTARSLM